MKGREHLKSPLFYVALVCMVVYVILIKQENPTLWFLIPFGVAFVCILILSVRQNKKEKEAQNGQGQTQSESTWGSRRSPSIRQMLAMPLSYHVKALAALAVMVVFALRKNAPLPVYGMISFVGVMQLTALLLAWMGKERDAQWLDRAAKIFERVLAVLVGVFALGFIGFWLYMVISHGVWFMAPFGLLIGGLILAVVIKPFRSGSKSEKDPAQAHVRSGREKDPWDD